MKDNRHYYINLNLSKPKYFNNLSTFIIKNLNILVYFGSKLKK